MDREFGSNAEPMLTAYRNSRPSASPTDLYIAITTARMIGIGAVTIAERKYAQRGAPVYMYVFTHESNNLVPGTQHKVGAAHAAEIPYKFYNVRPQAQPAVVPSNGAGLMSVSGPENEKAAHNMAEMWSTFAWTGRPAAKGQPAWPAYTTEKRSTMEIDAECRVVDNPFRLEREIWERLDP